MDSFMAVYGLYPVPTIQGFRIREVYLSSE